MINTISFKLLCQHSKYPTFVDLVILNPTITVILMAKFNPTITAEYISYTMGTHALPYIALSLRAQ